MVESAKYGFSFTASAIRVNKFEKVLRHLSLGEDIDITNDLGNGKSSTGTRVLSDLNKRAKVLNQEMIDLYLESDFQTQRSIAYLSICKAYDFIRDFVIEVIREKFLVYDYQITEGDFITFFRRKCEMHSEMDTLTDDTRYKIKQITFKLLEQVGMIDDVKSKTIQPQIMDVKLIDSIASDDKQWLKVFLMSDMDIENTTI
jgi:hypothetical protein